MGAQAEVPDSCVPAVSSISHSWLPVNHTLGLVALYLVILALAFYAA